MNLYKVSETIGRGTGSVIKVLWWVAAVLLTFMCCLICANIFARYLFKHPIVASLETTTLAIVIVSFAVVAFAELRRGHIVVDVLVLKLSKRAQVIVTSTMRLISAAFFIVLAYEMVIQMWSMLFPTVRRTELLKIPLAPFMFWIGFGGLLCAVQMVVNALHDLSSPPGGGDRKENK